MTSQRGWEEGPVTTTRYWGGGGGGGVIKIATKKSDARHKEFKNERTVTGWCGFHTVPEPLTRDVSVSCSGTGTAWRQELRYVDKLQCKTFVHILANICLSLE